MECERHPDPFVCLYSVSFACFSTFLFADSYCCMFHSEYVYVME
jgi:hypothetical protein